MVKNKHVDKIILEDGSTVTDTRIIADEISKFLISVQSDTQNIDQVPPELQFQPKVNSFFIDPVTELEVLNTIKKSKKQEIYRVRQI